MGRQGLHRCPAASAAGRLLVMTSAQLGPENPDDGPPPEVDQLAPPPGPLPQRPPLRRSSTDVVLSGICGGLAEHTGVESMLWRVGFIALAVMGPGIPLYILLWLLIPADPGSRVTPGGTGLLERLRKGLTPSR
jgi:phage shock protein PspC (stress-responsive transcriptional regulator)